LVCKCTGVILACRHNPVARSRDRENAKPWRISFELWHLDSEDDYSYIDIPNTGTQNTENPPLHDYRQWVFAT